MVLNKSIFAGEITGSIFFFRSTVIYCLTANWVYFDQFNSEDNPQELTSGLRAKSHTGLPLLQKPAPHEVPMPLTLFSGYNIRGSHDLLTFFNSLEAFPELRKALYF